MPIPTEFPDLFGIPFAVGDYISVPIDDMPYIAEVVGFTPKMVKLKFITKPWSYRNDIKIKKRELTPGRFIKVDPQNVTMLLLKNSK